MVDVHRCTGKALSETSQRKRIYLQFVVALKMYGGIFRTCIYIYITSYFGKYYVVKNYLV